MANVYKILAQSKPGAASSTDLYTVGGSTEAIVSTLTVCNQSSVATSFRVSLAPAGAGLATSQYMYFDVAIAGNDTFAATLGISLATTDVIRVYNTLATLSFTVTGVEIS